MHQIIIKKARFYSFHGVMEQERVVGASFTIDLTLDTDFTHAMHTDQLDGTISYADVYEVLKEEMATPSQLLEHVGGRIVARLHAEYPTIKGIDLTLIKDNPPMGADCQGAGIRIKEKY